MHDSKKKFRELFRFFERLSFLISSVLLFAKNVLRKKQNSALQKLIFYENIAIYIL